MNTQWSVSFRVLMGALFFCVISFCFLIIYAVHVGFVEKNDLEGIKAHAASQTASLALLLQSDVMSGFYPAIVQRANRALELQPELVGLNVKMRNGYVVFNKEKEGVDPNKTFILERRIHSSSVAGQAPGEEDWIGSVRAHIDLAPHAELMRRQRRAIGIFGGLMLLLALGLSAVVAAALARPIHRLAGEMKLGNLERLRDISPDGAEKILELRDLFAETNLLARQNLEFQAELVERTKEAALSEQARQVAHDIRSPLAALEVVSGDVAQLPEDKRKLITGAVGRIRDIANSLLDKHRTTEADMKARGQEAPASCLLSSLIESVISEKRLQFRSRSGVEIEACLDVSASYGIFARVQSIEFMRLLSNLVNNAVESFSEGDGAVRVSLSVSDGRARVSVQDDGKGIPPEILSKLGRRGETYGKAGGSGLGLHHARTTAEASGGSLEITSELGKGTTMIVLLPLASAPGWFVPGLRFSFRQAVVILDDDAGIHQVWQGRLDALKASERGVEIVHVSTPNELRGWVGDNPRKACDARYLLDHELQGCKETGLMLAEELGLGERSILVTSRYEEPAIMESCRRLNIRMIPKGLAGIVPIQIETPAQETALERWDAILIDDDALVRATWKAAASRLGKSFRAFPAVAGFLEASPAIDRETSVYIDSELGDGLKGEVEALKIHELGFGAIYLATGHEAEKFAGLAHLRGVVGKAPPWA